MKKSEKNMIFQEAALMSDEKLKEAYYDSVDACLGSQAEIMEDRGWDPVDIKERRQYEKFLSEKSDLLGFICNMRGIKLWEIRNHKLKNRREIAFMWSLFF